MCRGAHLAVNAEMAPVEISLIRCAQVFRQWGLQAQKGFWDFFFSLQCCDEGKKCRIHHYLWFEVSCGSMRCQENRETSCGPKGEEQHPGARPGSWWATWTRGPRTGAGNPWLNRNLSWALPLGREGKSFFSGVLLDPFWILKWRREPTI